TNDRYDCNVVLEIVEGVRANVEEIRIEGNSFTRNEVILREIPFRLPDLFNDNRATIIQRALQRTELFTSVSTPEFFLTADRRGAIMIRVQEGNPNRFDGMIGYSPAGRGTAGVVTGLADIQFRNLFGTGRKFTVRWMKESASTQEWSLWYFEPWVASLPVNAEAGFVQRKQDSSYIRRNYSGKAYIRLTQEFSAGFTVEHMRVVPVERVGVKTPGSASWSLGGSVRYDSRDNAITPTQGVLYSTTVEIGWKRVEGRSMDATKRLSFDTEAYLPLTRLQVLAGGLHGREYSAPVVEDADLFLLGGTTTLRGYRENQFRGSRIAWLTLEYRLLTGGRSYLFGFTDVGYIRIPEVAAVGVTGSEITRWGYGIGTRLDTGIGLITVGLAFGEGDTFRTAKLHIRLVNEF
ncbi:MAG: BamA/TamA family outer membrane protein, partial [Ignavibacteriales bacterium]|nr:BamA/TamA family outer membrane protein [Ignavibacteriales bacterium]